MEPHPSFTVVIFIAWLITLTISVMVFKIFCSRNKVKESQHEIEFSLRCLCVSLFVYVFLVGGIKTFQSALNYLGVSLSDSVFQVRDIVKFVANVSIVLQFVIITILFILRLQIRFVSTAALQYPRYVHGSIITVVIFLTLAAFEGIFLNLVILTAIGLSGSGIICTLLTYISVNGLYQQTHNDANVKTARFIIKCTVFLVGLSLDMILLGFMPLNLWMAIDSLVNVLCIYLQFSFGNCDDIFLFTLSKTTKLEIELSRQKSRTQLQSDPVQSASSQKKQTV